MVLFQSTDIPMYPVAPTLTLIACGDGGDCLQCAGDSAHPGTPALAFGLALTAELRSALTLWSQLLDQCLAKGKENADGLCALPEDWDWRPFHAQGLALARRVKAEVGEACLVLYAKCQRDPNHRWRGVTEILSPRSALVRADPGPPVLPWCSMLVSGGQTGADRAALDFAIGLACPHGGWVPQGRLSDDGVVPLRYQLTELPQGGYRQRMKRNVADSDATLVFNTGPLDGGTRATAEMARRLGKPCLLVQMDDGVSAAAVCEVLAWLRLRPLGSLNVAGPRESKRPGIYLATLEFLTAMQATLK